MDQVGFTVGLTTDPIILSIYSLGLTGDSLDLTANPQLPCC